MRYDTTMEDASTALDIINTSSEYDLIQMFKRFGEEKYSERLAETIIKER